MVETQALRLKGLCRRYDYATDLTNTLHTLLCCSVHIYSSYFFQSFRHNISTSKTTIPIRNCRQKQLLMQSNLGHASCVRKFCLIHEPFIAQFHTKIVYCYTASHKRLSGSNPGEEEVKTRSRSDIYIIFIVCFWYLHIFELSFEKQ